MKLAREGEWNCFRALIGGRYVTGRSDENREVLWRGKTVAKGANKFALFHRKFVPRAQRHSTFHLNALLDFPPLLVSKSNFVEKFYPTHVCPSWAKVDNLSLRLVWWSDECAVVNGKREHRRERRRHLLEVTEGEKLVRYGISVISNWGRCFCRNEFYLWDIRLA